MANRKKMIAVALGLSISISVAGVRPAWAQSSDDIQHKIDQVHNKQEAKQEQVKKDKKQLKQINQKRDQAIKKLNKLKGEISDTQNQINKKQVDVEKTQGKIDQLKKQISETEKRIERRDKLLKKRVKYMYENGTTIDYLSVLLGSQSFSEFLDRVMALKLIAKQDKQLLEAQKADKKRLEADKAAVEKALSKLQDQLNALQDLKSQLNEKKQAEKALAEQLKEKAGEIKQDIKDTNNAMAYIESQIEDLIQKREAARKREAEARRKAAAQDHSSSAGHAQLQSSGSGLLTDPVPAGVVTSGYGHRTLRGSGDFHDGIDYGAPCGTPIHAAASGTVLYAGPASGFGNWIVVDLNNGLYTVYGHMTDSGILVHRGEHVSQGETIAKIGSNGDSTGCHLHFELDHSNLSGDHGVNPYPYF